MSALRTRGYTFLELLIITAIVVIIGTYAFLNLGPRRSSGELNSTAQEIASLLREAQSRSMNQSSNTVWGVHFENNTSTGSFFALYASPNYNASTMAGMYRLPLSVAYVTSSLAQGASSNIAFAVVTGQATASSSIRIMSIGNPALSSTISVASSGAVSY